MSMLDAAESAPLTTHSTLPWWKRVADVVIASLLLLLLTPLLLVLAAAIKLTSQGPVVYRHERFGLGGRRFEMFKLRTMHVDADHWLSLDPELHEQLRNGQKAPNDPRVTTLGRDLRMLSLDELPQLWNVVRGDMSLVGPRPLPTDTELSWYGDRLGAVLSVRPGMTGLWQVSGRSELPITQRVALDCEYVERMSPVLDLGILLRTTKVVLFPPGNGAY